MNKEPGAGSSLQDLRDAFDFAYGVESNITEAEAQEVFERAGIRGFIDRITKSKILGTFFPSQKGLADLTKLSFSVYGNLDNLPLQKKVSIPAESGDFKFIITDVSPFSGPQSLQDIGLEPNQLLFVADGSAYHKEIAETLGYGSTGHDALDPVNDLSTFGGGWIHVDHDKKTLTISQTSGSFGSPSNELADWMLETLAKQGYAIDINLDQQGNFFDSNNPLFSNIT